MLIFETTLIFICIIKFSYSFLSNKVILFRGFSLLKGVTNPNDVQTDSVIDKLFRPAHVGIPRKRMDLQFAVLLMR